MKGRLAGRAEARARHPAAAWQPDLAGMAARFTDRFSAEGRAWPAFAAALVVARGRTGLDRAGFASLLGVTEGTVGDLEECRTPPWEAPVGLSVVAPDMDWSMLFDAAAAAVAYAPCRAGTAGGPPAAPG